MYTGTVSGVLCREVYCLYCVLIWESPLLEVSYNIFITIKTSSVLQVHKRAKSIS